MPEENNQPPGEFKPNIYPVMYWALAYGLIAGVLLFLINMLSQYITYVWMPVFLGGLIWGAYRNYKKQKQAWSHNHGVPLAPQSVVNEFKEAAQDIFSASQTMMKEQAAEDAYQEQVAQEQAMQEQRGVNVAQEESYAPDEAPVPPEFAPPENEIPPPPSNQQNPNDNLPPRV